MNMATLSISGAMMGHVLSAFILITTARFVSTSSDSKLAYERATGFPEDRPQRRSITHGAALRAGGIGFSPPKAIIEDLVPRSGSVAISAPNTVHAAFSPTRNRNSILFLA